MSSHVNKHYAKLRFMNLNASGVPRGSTTIRVDLKYRRENPGPPPSIVESEWWGRESFDVQDGSLGEVVQTELAFDVPAAEDPIERLGYYLNFDPEPNAGNVKFLPIPSGILVQDIEVLLSDTTASMVAFLPDGTAIDGRQWEIV
jgi:hypothetical protein